MLYVWYQKKRGDQDAIHEENKVIKMQGKIANVKERLRQEKRTCLIMRVERNSLSINTVSLQYSCRHSCQETAPLLSRDCSTPVSKMLEYFLICTLFTLLLCLYVQAKRYLTLLKMPEDNLVFFDFDPP